MVLVCDLRLFLLLGVVGVWWRRKWVVGGGSLGCPTLPADDFPLSAVDCLVDIGLGEVAVAAPANHVVAHNPHEVSFFDGDIDAGEAEILSLYANGSCDVEEHVFCHQDARNHFLWGVEGASDEWTSVAFTTATE